MLLCWCLVLDVGVHMQCANVQLWQQQPCGSWLRTVWDGCAHCTFAPQVKLGLEEVATDLFRVKPYVYSAPNNAAVIVFSGEVMQPCSRHTQAMVVL
jgi:hypothetical protein